MFLGNKTSIAALLAGGQPIASPAGSTVTLKGPKGKDIQIRGLRPGEESMLCVLTSNNKPKLFRYSTVVSFAVIFIAVFE